MSEKEESHMYLTIHEYDHNISSLPKCAVYNDEMVNNVNILNHYIQLMSYDRKTESEVYPPMIINIQEYSKEILNMSKEVTFNDILKTLNNVWVKGINKLLVSSKFCREDDSNYFSDKLIFREDCEDLTLFDIYAQSMRILPDKYSETESYRYRYTLENNIPFLELFTHS